jgi:DNA ligase-1
VPSVKPMLGTTATRDEIIKHLADGPLLASFKLDGIRALIVDGVVMSRSMKPIPNACVQRWFGRKEFEGLDGELIAGQPTDPAVFRQTTHCVMGSANLAEGAVRFFVFDVWNLDLPFHRRAAKIVMADDRFEAKGLVSVEQQPVSTIEDIDRLFEVALDCGFEGLVLKRPELPYKHGRSTAKEGGLLKIKPFVDAEAEVIGLVEQMHNGNVAEKDAFGRTKRSSAKAGKTGMSVLGALVCKTPEGQEFEIGTGFSAEEREAYWLDTGVVGRLVKYKSLVIGVKDKPRHAVFLGFRDRRDV